MAGEQPPTRHPVMPPEVFPFGVEFQKSLLRLLTEDSQFANAVMPHLQPGFFENDVLAWSYQFLTFYKDQYNAVPSLRVLMDETRRLDVSVQAYYQATMEQVMVADLAAEDWIRDKTVDFIKRNIFVRAYRESRDIYNRGEVNEAYDYMMQAMDDLHKAVWKAADREFFFEEFPQRYSGRLSEDPMMDSISTGIPELDHILGGGLSIGEMGIWLAHSKRGKTTMLANHGVQAVRRGSHNVLHAIFEGSRKLVAARYDTIFAQEAYQLVKSSGISAETYQRMQYDYQMFTQRLILRGFVEEWNYSVADIYEEIRELKRLHNWVPALVIVDYGDLLRSREDKGHLSETEHQRAAFRDLKSLANRGYGLWSASQAQRPKDDKEDLSVDVLRSRKIADCYDKVRVADFLGSLNQTPAEKKAHQMRVHAELYRENEAEKTILVCADFNLMTISSVWDTPGGVLPAPVVNAPTPMGYIAPQQRKAPV